MSKYLLLMLTFVTYSQLSFSGSSGDHMHFNQMGRNQSDAKINNKKAIEISQQHVFRLVMKGKLDRGWLKSSPLDSIQKKYHGKNEWVTKIKNDKEIMNRKILFIFLSLDGKFIAANFTGK